MKKTIILILVLIIFPLVFAQTTGFVSFQIKVDKTGPEYNHYNSNTSSINNLNESVLFSAYWNDNYGLDSYYFEWNISGNFVNSSSQSFDNGWSNITQSITNASCEGQDIFYRFYGFDENNNLNSTTLNNLNLVSLAPEYSYIEQSDNNPTAGDIVNISSYWTDNFNVYNSTMQTNYSGDWLDNSTVYLNSINGWANFTFDTTGYSSQTVWWRILGFDNATNVNITDESYFNVI